jgi:hypothetical protein
MSENYLHFIYTLSQSFGQAQEELYHGFDANVILSGRLF